MNVPQQPNGRALSAAQAQLPAGTAYPHQAQAAWNAVGTVLPSDPQPSETKGSTGSRWVKLGLAVLVGLGVGWGVKWCIESLQTTARSAMAMGQSPATGVAQTPVSGQGAPVLAGLQATLVMWEREFNLGADQVALPAGSRLQIKVNSAQAGLLVIQAINPQGQASAAPMWSSRVLAGQSVTTGMLRLEGSKGRENLLIQLRPANGAAPVTHNVYLWHL